MTSAANETSVKRRYSPLYENIDSEGDHCVKADKKTRHRTAEDINSGHGAQSSCVEIDDRWSVRRRRRLPSVCHSFNTSTGCNHVNCDSLHVCYYWATGKCRYGRLCQKRHDISDVLNQCVLSSLGWRYSEFNQAIEDMRRAYRDGNPPSSNPRVNPAVQVCLEYSTAVCSRPKCLRFHVCHSFIQGTCIYSSLCSLNHDVVGGKHNTSLLQRIPAVADMSVREIRIALKISLHSVVVLPSICDRYNSISGCGESFCKRLHCCKHYVVFNRCKFKNKCYKNHDINSEHNKRILKHFKVSAERVLELLRARAPHSSDAESRPESPCKNREEQPEEDREDERILQTLRRRNEFLESELLTERKVNLERQLLHLTVDE